MSIVAEETQRIRQEIGEIEAVSDREISLHNGKHTYSTTLYQIKEGGTVVAIWSADCRCFEQYQVFLQRLRQGMSRAFEEGKALDEEVIRLVAHKARKDLTDDQLPPVEVLASWLGHTHDCVWDLRITMEGLGPYWPYHLLLGTSPEQRLGIEIPANENTLIQLVGQGLENDYRPCNTSS